RLTFAGKRLAGLLRVALAPVLLEAHEAFLARLRPPDFFWVRSTDSRRADIRSTTSPSGPASPGGGSSPSALARSSSSSALRSVSSYFDGSKSPLRFSTSDLAIPTSGLLSCASPSA